MNPVERTQPEPATLALPTRQAVVLVVDLVESVRLMVLDELGVIRRWRAFLDHVSEAVLPSTGGRLVKSLGDGLMAEFSSSAEAVRAARCMHDWMDRQCTPIASGDRMMLRAGLHATRIYDASFDILGVGVNLAARVATLAQGGETVATVDVRDQLTDALDAEIEDLGDCHLKHVDGAVRAYRLGPATQPGSLPQHDDHGEITISVAVLPFANSLSGGPSVGLGDLVADGIIGQLSRSAGLKVVSRLSTAAFRDRATPIEDIGARLKVQYVVSGTYAVDGAQVLVSAEVSEVSTRHVLGSFRKRGRWRDLLTIDSEIVHELADAVHRELLEVAAMSAIAKPLPSLKSYELFLGGVAMMHRANPAEFDTSRKLLDCLTERHRRISLPHAWLGKWYALRSIQGVASDLSAAAATALQHTGRALDLEPCSALALAIEGFVYCHLKKDLDTAEDRLREACRLNPSEGFGWLFLAILDAFRGRPAPALEAVGRAVALSPLDPLRYFYESLTGSCELSAGNYDEAIRWCESARRRNRYHISTLRILITAYAAADRQAQARAVAAELLRMKPGYTVAAYEANSVAVLYPFGQQIARAMREAGIP